VVKTFSLPKKTGGTDFSKPNGYTVSTLGTYGFYLNHNNYYESNN
jgi:hypothetical protein